MITWGVKSRPTLANSCRIRTSEKRACNPFRIRTYKKRWDVGVLFHRSGLGLSSQTNDKMPPMKGGATWSGTAKSRSLTPIRERRGWVRDDEKGEDAGAEARRYTCTRKLPAFPTQNVGAPTTRKAAST